MSERMQWSEAEAVVRAYRAERGSTSVDVATVARALGTDVAEVRRLAGRRTRFVDRSGVLSAAVALIVAAGALAFTGPSLLSHNPLLAMVQKTPPPTVEPPFAPALAYDPGMGDRTIHLRLMKAPDEPL